MTATKQHHLQHGEQPRVRLANGPTVDTNTAQLFSLWTSRGPSIGQLIDRLTSHALASGFCPVTCTIVPRHPVFASNPTKQQPAP